MNIKEKLQQIDASIWAWVKKPREFRAPTPSNLFDYMMRLVSLVMYFFVGMYFARGRFFEGYMLFIIATQSIFIRGMSKNQDFMFEAFREVSEAYREHLRVDIKFAQDISEQLLGRMEKLSKHNGKKVTTQVGRPN